MNTVSRKLLFAAIMLLPSTALADYPGHYRERHDCEARGQYGSTWDGGHNWPIRANHSPSKGRGFDKLLAQGIRDGRLSRDEVRELRAQQREIELEKRRYLSDGHINRYERHELHEEYRDLYGDLRHELRDGETRKPRHHFW